MANIDTLRQKDKDSWDNYVPPPYPAGGAGYAYFTKTQERDWRGPILRPIPGKTVDVVNQCVWASNMTQYMGEKELPIITIEEYKLNMNAMLSNVVNTVRATGNSAASIASTLFGAVKGGAADPTQLQAAMDAQSDLPKENPLEGMYSADPTGFVYRLPIVGDTGSDSLKISQTQHWGDVSMGMLSQAPKADIIKNVAVAFAEANQISQPESQTGAEKIKQFMPARGNSFSFSVTLLNTEDASAVQRHWEVAFLLSYQCLQHRRSINLIEPPPIYKYTIQGYRHSPAAVMSSVDVINVGNSRMINIAGQDRLIPEAYHIRITLTDLLGWGKNFHGFALTGDKVNIIADVRGQK